MTIMQLQMTNLRIVSVYFAYEDIRLHYFTSLTANTVIADFMNWNERNYLPVQQHI